MPAVSVNVFVDIPILYDPSIKDEDVFNPETEIKSVFVKLCGSWQNATKFPWGALG